MSRVRRYSRSGPTAQPPRSPTGLSPPAVTRSSGLRLTDAGAARRLPPPPAHSSNPLLASPAGCSATRVWAPPRSLAATKGILSVPRGTEMFQFPRCPLTDSSVSARPCAGRVAPFGHPRIAGCQRLPGAFRRVAASFLGRQRQGIHHAPILRISCAASHPRSVVSATADRHAPAGWSRLVARPPRCPVRTTPRGITVCLCGSCVFVCLCMCCAVRAGTQTRARRRLLLPGRADGSDRARPLKGWPRPAAAEPDGFRVAHCQGAERRERLPIDPKVVQRPESRREVVKPRPKSCPDLGGDFPTCWRADGRVAHAASRPAPGVTGRRWSRGDSNPGPPPCKGGALPAKLRPPTAASRRSAFPLQASRPNRVGAPGLEPGTSALSGPRSNHLSYAPATPRTRPVVRSPAAAT
jgi:hypothetical protein